MIEPVFSKMQRLVVIFTTMKGAIETEDAGSLASIMDAVNDAYESEQEISDNVKAWAEFGDHSPQRVVRLDTEALIVIAGSTYQGNQCV